MTSHSSTLQRHRVRGLSSARKLTSSVTTQWATFCVMVLLLLHRYEYLKKIIHLPFAIPAPKDKDKRKLIDAMLESETDGE